MKDKKLGQVGKGDSVDSGEKAAMAKLNSALMGDSDDETTTKAIEEASGATISNLIINPTSIFTGSKNHFTEDCRGSLK